MVIYGINYEDDNAAAIKWLNELHNPYLLSISDADGTWAWTGGTVRRKPT